MKAQRRYVTGVIALVAVMLLVAGTVAYAQGVWQTNAPLPAGFGREGACIAGSSAADVNGVAKFRIYIAAGFGPFGDSNTNTAYDPETDTYTTGLAPRPGPPNSEGAGAGRGGFVYCLGGRGFGATNRNDRYDPSTNSWTTLAPLPIGVAAEYSAAVVGNEIHVIGGRLAGPPFFATVPFSGPKTNAHQVYKIGRNTWSTTSDPPLPGAARSEMCAVAHGNKIYVMGGNVVSFDAVANLDIYNVSSKTWSPGAPMPAPRANAACGVLGNSIYVAGGIHPFGVFHNSTMRYDIDTGTWTIDTPMPVATAETTGVSHGGQIFVITGGFFGAGGGPLGTVNQSFRATPP